MLPVWSARTRLQVLEEPLKNPMNPLIPGDETWCLLLQGGLTTELHLPWAEGWGQGCQADGWMLLEPCKVSDICNVPLCDQRPCAVKGSPAERRSGSHLGWMRCSDLS